jgi:hypothetical protein
MRARVPRWRATAPQFAALLAGLAAAATVTTACQPLGGLGAAAQPTRSMNLRNAPPGSGISPAAPFAGSPSAGYADGADGIRPPAAKAMAGFTAAQVRAHLKTVKRAMVLANLDPKVWTGARPTGLFALLEPRHGRRAEAERAFRRPTRQNNPLLYATRFEPTKAVVHGPVVKVHGRMTVRGMQPGVLRVRTNYLYVYPVRRLVPPVGQVQRVIVRRTIDFAFYDAARFQVTPGKIYLQRYGYSYAGAGCDDSNGFLRPEFTTSTDANSVPSGTPVDPYDLDRTRPHGCHDVTRT